MALFSQRTASLKRPRRKALSERARLWYDTVSALNATAVKGLGWGYGSNSFGYSPYQISQQDGAYRADLLPADVLKISIEAGVTQGWERYIGQDGLAIGLDRFGASAPAAVLFEHFGFSAEKIVPQIQAKLGQ